MQRLGLQSRFEALRAGHAPLDVTINLPGRHNVLNSLAALAVATELEIPDAAIQRALANFQGIERRLQQLGEIQWPGGRALIVDDYGHHPTEVAATLEAVRQGWPKRRLVLVFQPHRYTRTRDLLDDFGRTLSECDVLLVTEVYAAGEAPIAGADGRAICRAVRSRGLVEPIFVESVDDLAESLRAVLQDGDLVLTMGAGNLGAVAQDLKSRFAAGARGMNAQHSLELAPEFSSRVLHDVSMAKHTSWHAGGSADLFFTPRDIMDLASFVRQLPGSAAALDRARQQSAGARRRNPRRRRGDAWRLGRARTPQRDPVSAPKPACPARASRGNA